MKAVVAPFLFLTLATPLGAEPPARSELSVLEAQLDRAVSRVSRPAGLLVLGLPGTRAYRISGLGVVFVLPPRTFETGTPEVRFLRHGSPQRDSSSQVPEDEIRALERQVLVFADAAESTRRVAERHADAVEKEIRVRLELEVRQSPEGPGPQSAQDSPPMLPPPPPPPAAPPWLVWLQDPALEDERPPERLVEQVRTAVIDTLETYGLRIRSLKSDEHIVVAVDFVAPEQPFAPPERQKTLVVRVKKQTLVDRAAKRMTSEDLRKNIIVEEY